MRSKLVIEYAGDILKCYIFHNRFLLAAFAKIYFPRNISRLHIVKQRNFMWSGSGPQGKLQNKKISYLYFDLDVHVAINVS